MSQETKHRKFPREFREQALRRLALAPNVAQLCRELDISRQLLHQWKAARQREMQKQSRSTEYRLRRENAELQKALGKKALEVDFLKAVCEKVEALRRTATGSGETASGK